MRILLLLLFATAPLLADPVLVEEVAGVQLMRTERHDSDAHHHGFTYSAVNRNTYPVYVSIRLTQSENTYDGLLPGAILVQPDQEASLGWVTQASPKSPSSWAYSWTIHPAETSSTKSRE